MAKYSLDLDEKLKAKVKNLSAQYGLKDSGVLIEPIRLLKGKTYGEVKQSSEMTQLFSGKDNMVVVALYEELFEQFDEKTQDMLIFNLLEQIVPQEDKDGNVKVKVGGTQLNVGLNTYHTYSKAILDGLEAVLLTLDQMEEQEKAAKEQAKEERKANKKKKY